MNAEEEGTIGPNYQAKGYFQWYENRDIGLPSYKSIRLVKPPEHGTVAPYKHPGNGIDSWRYQPNNGYLGNDKAEFMVGEGETAVRVIYYFKVSKLNLDDSNVINKMCKQHEWKISLANLQRP